MVAVRDSSLNVTTGFHVEVDWPAGAQVGDRAFALVFGGNHVTDYYPNGAFDDTWESLSHVLGQEAQGEILTKIVTEDNLDTGFYYVEFDGNDPSRIVTLITEGDVGYQVAESARDGSVGSTLLAYEQDEETRALAGELLCYFVGARNATDLPTNDVGTLTHSYAGTHTAAFWVAEAAGGYTQATLGIPQRSGHYRAVLRLFDWYLGDWFDDADEVSVPVDGTFSTSSNMVEAIDVDDPPYADLFDRVWTLDGDVTESSPTNGHYVLSATDTRSVLWRQAWASIQRQAATATESETPDPWPDEALGIEWEPSSEILRYTLGIFSGTGISGDPTFGSAIDPDPFQFKVVETAAPYAPGLMSAAALNAVPSAAIDTYHPGDTLVSAVITLPTGVLGSWVGATIVDPYTASLNGGYSGIGVGSTIIVSYSIRLNLDAVLRPRYRFRYDPLDFVARVSPPLLRYPRGDGYGVGPTVHYPPPGSRLGAGGYR